MAIRGLESDDHIIRDRTRAGDSEHHRAGAPWAGLRRIDEPV